MIKDDPFPNPFMLRSDHEMEIADMRKQINLANYSMWWDGFAVGTIIGLIWGVSITILLLWLITL